MAPNRGLGVHQNKFLKPPEAPLDKNWERASYVNVIYIHNGIMPYGEEDGLHR